MLSLNIEGSMYKILTVLVAFTEITLVHAQSGTLLSASQTVTSTLLSASQTVTSVALPLSQTPSSLPTPTQSQPFSNLSSLREITSVRGTPISNVTTVLSTFSGINLVTADTSVIISNVLTSPALTTAQTSSFSDIPSSEIITGVQREPPDVSIPPVVTPIIPQITPPTSVPDITPSISSQPELTSTPIPSQQIFLPSAKSVPPATTGIPSSVPAAQQPQAGIGPRPAYAITLTGSDGELDVATVFETSTVRRMPVPTAAGKGTFLRVNKRMILAVMVLGLVALVG